MQKPEALSMFRTRLHALVKGSGGSQSQFARTAGIDRSTLSLLLSDNNTRLPRAESLAGIAAGAKVSIDWLLGLSDSPGTGPEALSAPTVASGADDPGDEHLRNWHLEARGQKLRYVPSALPDQIKTDAVIAYELRKQASASAEALAQISRERIAHARAAYSEIEVCMSRQELEGFARGEGVWRQLGARERRRQLEQIAQLTDQFYPNYRLFLFDARRNHASPYTVFGQQRAAVYMGGFYIVFTAAETIRELTRHFEALLRQAVVQPTEVSTLARRLLREIG